MSSVMEALDLEVPAGKNLIAILDKSGDTKIVWDPNRPEEVENARQSFDSLKEKGYTAYKVNRDGEKGEVARNFDPTAAKIILAPRMVGG